MTTVAQVKHAVQPLLHRNPDLALVGRLLVIKPVHHILRGISLRRSLDPLLIVPTWAVIFLFEPCDSFSYNWGERVYGPSGVWDISDPDLPETLCAAIEGEALPHLRPVKAIDNFVSFTSKDRFPQTFLDGYEHRRIFVDIARGDLEAARSICEYMTTSRAKGRYLPEMQKEYDRITIELSPLIAANDRAGLARLLHAYEAQSVKNLKLEKFWEPTPFPIEQSA